MKNHFKKAVFLAVNAAVASVLLGSAGVASAAETVCNSQGSCAVQAGFTKGDKIQPKAVCAYAPGTSPTGSRKGRVDVFAPGLLASYSVATDVTYADTKSNYVTSAPSNKTIFGAISMTWENTRKGFNSLSNSNSGAISMIVTCYGTGATAIGSVVVSK